MGKQKVTHSVLMGDIHYDGIFGRGILETYSIKLDLKEMALKIDD